jgi:hypothetical protein
MLIDNTNKGEYQVEDGIYDLGWSISVVLSEDEVALLLAEYFPDSSTSPPVSACRPIVRAILDSIKAKQ